MAPTILITYATKHGSTREVAEAIAANLAGHGFAVRTEPATAVRDLSPYGAVVLGTALYMGRVHADARRFLRRHHGDLSRVPFAVFGMGPLTTGEQDVAGARSQLEHGLAAASGLTPVATAIFGGVVKPDQLRFPFSHMQASDARDWAAVELWANELRELLDGTLAVPTAS